MGGALIRQAPIGGAAGTQCRMGGGVAGGVGRKAAWTRTMIMVWVDSARGGAIYPIVRFAASHAHTLTKPTTLTLLRGMRMAA